MRQYELTYLIDDNVGESDLNKVTGKVGGYLKDLGGKVLKEEIWGRRKLAYPINKQEFATYVTINFEMGADKVNDFEHNIKMTGKIIRHLMIVNEIKEEKLSLTADDIAGAEEIKDVIGGERSFEAVEGETTDSRDLMAKRSEEVKEEVASEAKAEVREEEVAEEIKEEVKAEVKAVKAKKVAKVEETKEEIKEEPKKAKVAKKKADEGNEAERLTMLDKELDDILGEDL